MLDENLPTFFLKPVPSGPAHHESFHLTYQGSAPAPAYTLQRLDPSLPTSRNRHAAALFDAHNPSILYGEVLLEPGWTQPTLSAEEIRRNGGVAPAPQPITPDAFTIQLYNPDQQVVVREKTPKGLLSGGSPSYAFELPVTTFRTPSASLLDRAGSDPAADAATPTVRFAWRKDGRRDWACVMTGKSTDHLSAAEKRKNKKNVAKEPDIAVALFAGLKEVSVYEPNLYRVDIEDPKGLEVVLLLSAVVLRDVYLGGSKDPFNVGDALANGRKNSGGRKLSGAAAATSSPPLPHSASPGAAPAPAAPAPAPHRPQPPAAPAAASPVATRPPPPRQQQHLPPTSATAAAASATAATTPHLARPTTDDNDPASKRLRKQLEREEKERRDREKRRQEQVRQETERLRRVYGDQRDVEERVRAEAEAKRAAQRLARQHQPRPQTGHHHGFHVARVGAGGGGGGGGGGAWGAGAGPPRPPQMPVRPVSHGPYLQVGGSGGRAAQSSAALLGSNGLPLGGSGGGGGGGDGYLRPQSKRSFWGLRSHSDGHGAKLNKKQSSLF
ncbi:hypothetical protein BDY21DRAFT_382470 [Lineolata rhizophorae]|uniref:Uncharacterized protein n=1 Tax=Lineolata rhizophorae TaxID=578093 RepID=A0A6A6NMG1_9PEZI|nr:hypothetical protein BDY21DRAFT_382470 [Lineolata rhizophorae]